MANNIIRRTWKQGGLVNIEDLRGSAFQAESGGHTFQISGVDIDGNPLALSGTPAGVLLRADGQDVALTCSVSDGIVSATLPANAYVVPGRVGITIFLTSDGQKTAIYAAVGSVATTSSGTVAPPAGSDVVDLVNAIATAVAKIPASYTDLMAAVAPTYSTSALYAVGSYAWYDGKLYRCTTAITSGETWTSGHWTLANLGSDVSDLKSAIDGQNKGYQEEIILGNYIPYEMDFQRGNLNPSTGEFVSGMDYRVASKRSIKISKKITCAIASGFRVLPTINTGSGWAGSWQTGTFNILANTETRLLIARSTDDTSEVADIDTFLSKVTWPKGFSKELSETVEDLKDKTDGIESAIGRLSNVSGTESDGFWNTSNSQFSTSSSFKTITIDVDDTTKRYYYSGQVYSTTIVSGAVFLNSSNAIIGHALDGINGTAQTFVEEPIGDIPSGTAKIAFGGYVGGGAEVGIKVLTIASVYSEKDFVVTGDSIETESAGKWPAMLKNAISFKSYTNKAVGGTCMAAVGDDYISSDARMALMPATADIVLVGGGTNDWGNNVELGDITDLSSNTNFAGAVYSMITKLQTKYPNALIIFTSNQNTCSPNRHNFDDQTGWKNNRNLTAADYADMMEKVCKFAAIPYIDTNHLCAINRLNYTSFLLQETNYYGDTVYMHPNEAGAKRMFRVIYDWFKNNAPIE